MKRPNVVVGEVGQPLGAPPDLHALATQLSAELGTEVTIDHVLRDTGKTLLVTGDYRGRPAAIKACRTEETFWRDKFDHEIGIYRAFAACPPPIRVPELIHLEDAGIIVLELVPGRVVDTERYPADPVPPTVLDTVLNTMIGFGAWNPPSGCLAPAFDYQERVDSYHRAGIFDEDDRLALHRIVDAVGPIDVVSHGDPLPANLLISDEGECVPVDFEFTGLFAAGFDLAMLHTVLAASPGAQSRIEEIIAESGIETPFMLNQAMVLSREMRLHTELDAGEFRDARLALIGPQWDVFRSRLHEWR